MHQLGAAFGAAPVHHHLDAEIISYVVTQASLARSTRLFRINRSGSGHRALAFGGAIRLMQLRAKLAFPPSVAQSASVRYDERRNRPSG